MNIAVSLLQTYKLSLTTGSKQKNNRTANISLKNKAASNTR